MRRDAETGRSCARLHLRVVQARSLPQMRRHRGSCDPYVEVAVDDRVPAKYDHPFHWFEREHELYAAWAAEGRLTLAS